VSLDIVIKMLKDANEQKALNIINYFLSDSRQTNAVDTQKNNKILNINKK